MPTDVDWTTRVITNERLDFTEVQPPPNEVRELNLETWHRDLRALEASEEGIIYDRTHNYSGPVTIGAVQLAPVVEVINGYTWTAEDGQYAVNFNGANTNLQDVTNVNQVSIRPNNSAGLTYSKQTEDQSFEDARIWIDTTGPGQSGTQFPIGTPGTPVDNLPDALVIINQRNLPRRLFLRGTVNVPSGFDLTDFDVKGSSNILARVDVTTSADTDGVVVERLTITGDLDGLLTGNESSTLLDTIDLEGTLLGCGLDGVLQLADNSETIFNRCYSEVAGRGTPVIVLGANCEVMLRGYSGGVELRNMTAGCSVSVDLAPGRLVIDDPSNTGGEISIKGIGDVITTDPVAQALDYDIDGFVNAERLRRAVQNIQGRAIVSLDDLSVSIYEEFGNDVLQTFAISADGRQRTDTTP